MQHYVKNKPYKSKKGTFYRLYEDRGLGNAPRYGIEEFNCENWVLLPETLTGDRTERNAWLNCILAYESSENEWNREEREKHEKQRISCEDWREACNR